MSRVVGTKNKSEVFERRSTVQEAKMTFSGRVFAVQFDILSREPSLCDYCEKPGVKHRVVIIKINDGYCDVEKESGLFKRIEGKIRKAFLDGHALCTRDSEVCAGQFNQGLNDQCAVAGVSLDSDFFTIEVKE